MKNQVIELTCAKHIKIYKLNQLGLTNKEVAESLNTNVGHVYNVLKSYKEDPKKVEKANNN
jgi:transcriptional regulator